jgi:hypothetical protein
MIMDEKKEKEKAQKDASSSGSFWINKLKRDCHMSKVGIAVMGVVLLAAACCVSGQFHGALEKGDEMPQGQVLLIGKFTVEPMVEQGNVVAHAPRGTHIGVIKMNFGDNADNPLDKEALVPFSSTEQMDFNFKKTSFIPLDPGTRFARLGTLMLDSSRYTYGFSRGGAPAPGGVDITYLMCYGDVKITVPQRVKAVYIGTVVYQHDLKNTKPNRFGYPSKRVVVRDEFKKAMQDLAAMKIPGITPKDVVKKLAVVIRPN